MTMNTSAFNLEAIRHALKDSKEPCPWQRLMDLGYRKWRRPENRSWCYRDMVEEVGETYGEVVKLFILLGAANYQICNGGFLQYFENGYASGERRGFHHREQNLLLHKEMLALAVKYGLHQSESGAQVYGILAEFRIVLGNDHEEGREDDGRRHDEVSNTDELDALDTRYYALNEKWVEALKVLAAKWLKTGTNPTVVADPPPEPQKPSLQPRVKLIGHDGNAFAIMGTVCEALRKAGASAETIRHYRRESMSGDYANLLATAMKYCDVH